ncbi:MAG: glycerol-3-phosphate dehydrogenase/oxidase, partial [Parafilimonas sp.]
AGGVVYYDGQFDDARLAIDLAKTAAKHGAVLLNYCKAASLLKTNNLPAGRQGKICGVIAEDVSSQPAGRHGNKTFEIKSKTIINATGVFVDHILKMDDNEAHEIVIPSQGIHLVIDKKNFPGNHALMIPKTDDKRVLFAVPWHNKVVLGTTDTPVEHTLPEPQPLDEEINFILQHANRYLKTNITLKDVTSMFAGLRPLVKIKGIKKTSMLNRDHTIIVSLSGLISITGGKWTTYRKMAEDAVNNAIFVGKFSYTDCRTRHLPIESSEFDNINYADETELEKVYSGQNITKFIKDEMAMTVEDILARRTRLLFLDVNAAVRFAPLVAKRMAAVFQKDAQWIKKEIDNFNLLAQGYLPATNIETRLTAGGT